MPSPEVKGTFFHDAYDSRNGMSAWKLSSIAQSIILVEQSYNFLEFIEFQHFSISKSALWTAFVQDFFMFLFEYFVHKGILGLLALFFMIVLYVICLLAILYLR